MKKYIQKIKAKVIFHTFLSSLYWGKWGNTGTLRIVSLC